MQRDLEPRDVPQRSFCKVAVERSQDGLVGDDADALALALDLDDGGLEALDDVLKFFFRFRFQFFFVRGERGRGREKKMQLFSFFLFLFLSLSFHPSTHHVALPGRVPVPQLVLLSRGELARVLVLYLRISPAVKGPRLDFIQNLPPEFGERQKFGRLDGPHQRRGPDRDGHGASVARQGHALDDDVREQPRVSLPSSRERGISSELPTQIVLRLAVPGQPDLADSSDSCFADLHEEEDDLARDVAGDAVDVHIAFGEK